MTTFNDRENAFENMYAHDAEMQFKAAARRNKLLGLWAAEILGLSGDEAAAYAKSVVIADLEEAGDEDVLRKVAADLEANGKPMATADLRVQMNALMTTAKQQIVDEAKP
jgi:hypothetical protein